MRSLSYMLVVMIVVALTTHLTVLVSQATYIEVILDVQRDGMVIVTHVINVTEQCVYLEVKALTKPSEPVLAIGKEVYDTSVEVVEGTYVIRVYAPDVGLLNLTYVTDALVRKELPNIWIMNFSCEHRVRAILPTRSIPVKVPESFIDLYESGGRYVILLPPGEHEIAWILRVKIPVLIPRGEILRVNVPKVVNSSDRLTMTVEVRNSGNVSSTIFVRITDKLKSEVIFYDSVLLAPKENKTFRVELTAPQVNEAKVWELVLECGHEDVVDDVKTLRISVKPTPQEFSWIIVATGVVTIIVAIVLGIALLVKKREHEELREVLTEVDTEIVRFLKSRGGKALQKEIVTSLGLPKTTVHRHLKKLQKYGIVDIERLGITNVVKLTKKLKI